MSRPTKVMVLLMVATIAAHSHRRRRTAIAHCAGPVIAGTEASTAAPFPRGTERTTPAPAGVGAGPWRFRVTAIAGIVVFGAAFRGLRAALWSRGAMPRGVPEKLLSYGALFWAFPALPAVLALAGIALYRSQLPGGAPTTLDRMSECHNEIAFRIVSRGQNVDVLRSSIDCIRARMRERPLFAYRVEVVTDRPVGLPPDPWLRTYVVPDGYATAAGTRYKARALQFALERSDLADDGWIFHLDEESHVSAELIEGIAQAVVEEEALGTHRIGQGLILYHRNLDTHPFLTLADMIRSGEDLGRFHFQHRMGVTIFGLHGSFILVRSSVERAGGFDVGPEGSITEDAFWALRQMAAGRRCRWVNGHLVEQAPETLRDFIKQRRRWFSGLIRVVLYAETKVWLRIPLALSTGLWAISWLGLAYTYVNLVTGLRTSPVITGLGDFAFATYTMGYVLGLYVNLRDRPKMSVIRRVAWHAAQLALLPMFTLLEAAGVILGMVRSEPGFHVVQKGLAARRQAEGGADAVALAGT